MVSVFSRLPLFPSLNYFFVAGVLPIIRLWHLPVYLLLLLASVSSLMFKTCILASNRHGLGASGQCFTSYPLDPCALPLSWIHLASVTA